MIRIFALFISFLFVAACSVSPQATPNRTYKQDQSDFSSENMKHGWADASQFPETKSYTSNKDSITRGQLLYQHHCQQCHGEKGKGDGPLAETLKIKPSDLTNLSKEIPQTYLSIRINKGKDSMPQWDHMLTTKQTWDLTQYVLHLSKK